LRDTLEEGFQAERRERRIKRTDEVFVEPLCFLNLEAYALNAGEFFCGYVDDKSDT